MGNDGDAGGVRGCRGMQGSRGGLQIVVTGVLVTQGPCSNKSANSKAHADTGTGRLRTAPVLRNPDVAQWLDLARKNGWVKVND